MKKKFALILIGVIVVSFIAMIVALSLNSNKVEFYTATVVVDENGNITTLGRGGSDTTAVALAASLKAERCDIFTDVDGVYSTDPKKMEDARKLNNVAYEEMLEMASMGAKVLHNRCVEIGKKYNIPIYVKSTFEKESIGTLVSQKNLEDLVSKDMLKLFKK